MINEASRSNPLRRSDDACIFETEDRLVAFDPQGRGYALTGDSAELARAVLDFLADAHSLHELHAHLSGLADGAIEHPEVIDELVVTLLKAEALQWWTAPDPASPTNEGRPRPSRIALGLSGAIAAMTAPELVGRLQRAGFVVRVLATNNALRFVSAEALEALTHHRVVRSMWPQGESSHVPHMELASWADAVVICPASATTVSRLATGNYECVVAATALTTRAPVMVVPSMNPLMYDSPSVQRNLATLRDDGMYFVQPGRGMEMADAPQRRAPLLGAAPPLPVVVRLVRGMLLDKGPLSDRSPDTGEDWDAMYRSGGEAPPPWHCEDVDPDIAQEVERLAPEPAAVLDIGTGLGTLAIALARQGHRVVATDLSALALEHAASSAPDAGVCWLQDDITTSSVRGTFDIALDRGCFHLLSDDAGEAYVDTLARLLPARGALILKSLAGETAQQLGTRDCTDAALERFFGDRFEIERSVQSELAGQAGTVPGRLVVLRRRE